MKPLRRDKIGNRRFIRPVQGQDGVSIPYGLAGAAGKVRPRPFQAFRWVARLRDDIGNAQPLADSGSDQIRCLVVEVIGEPEIGRPCGEFSGQPGDLPVRLVQQKPLSFGISVGFSRSQARHQFDLMSRLAQGGHQQAGDLSVT